MDTSTWVWIIVAVIVVIALIALVAGMGAKKRKEHHRERAGELREQAASQATGVQQQEAQARETEARAAQARAEADRLEAEAHDKESTAAEARERHNENLREADDLDPDVKHSAPTTGDTDSTGADTRGVPEDGRPDHDRALYDAEGNEVDPDRPGTHRA